MAAVVEAPVDYAERKRRERYESDARDVAEAPRKKAKLPVLEEAYGNVPRGTGATTYQSYRQRTRPVEVAPDVPALPPYPIATWHVPPTMASSAIFGISEDRSMPNNLPGWRLASVESSTVPIPSYFTTIDPIFGFGKDELIPASQYDLQIDVRDPITADLPVIDLPSGRYQYVTPDGGQAGQVDPQPYTPQVNIPPDQRAYEERQVQEAKEAKADVVNAIGIPGEGNIAAIQHNRWIGAAGYTALPDMLHETFPTEDAKYRDLQDAFIRNHYNELVDLIQQINAAITAAFPPELLPSVQDMSALKKKMQRYMLFRVLGTMVNLNNKDTPEYFNVSESVLESLVAQVAGQGQLVGQTYMNPEVDEKEMYRNVMPVRQFEEIAQTARENFYKDTESIEGFDWRDEMNNGTEIASRYANGKLSHDQLIREVEAAMLRLRSGRPSGFLVGIDTVRERLETKIKQEELRLKESELTRDQRERLTGQINGYKAKLMTVNVVIDHARDVLEEMNINPDEMDSEAGTPRSYRRGSEQGSEWSVRPIVLPMGRSQGLSKYVENFDVPVEQITVVPAERELNQVLSSDLNQTPATTTSDFGWPEMSRQTEPRINPYNGKPLLDNTIGYTGYGRAPAAPASTPEELKIAAAFLPKVLQDAAGQRNQITLGNSSMESKAEVMNLSQNGYQALLDLGQRKPVPQSMENPVNLSLRINTEDETVSLDDEDKRLIRQMTKYGRKSS